MIDLTITTRLERLADIEQTALINQLPENPYYRFYGVPVYLTTPKKKDV